MGTGTTGFIPRMGTVVLCCVGLSLPVIAAPPGKTELVARPVAMGDGIRVAAAGKILNILSTCRYGLSFIHSRKVLV